MTVTVKASPGKSDVSLAVRPEVLTSGFERTEADFAGLLQAAGFELVRVVPTRSPMSVLEARPAR